MQASSRPSGFEGGYNSTRSHAPKLSISDDNHHVTEAIGDMYGENDYQTRQDPRPLSFMPGAPSNSIEHGRNEYYDQARSRSRNTPGARSDSKGQPTSGLINGQSASPSPPSSSTFGDNGLVHSAVSPLQDQSSPNNPQAPFPLPDVDYQSDPAAVQKELINLQAIRRMSMDVSGNGQRDPDLPAFNRGFMPAISPPASDSEDDNSTLFWVPARLHPELAPREFKDFLENRMDQIKRRSGDASSLGTDGLERHGSGSSLRRKKSMLSRQIDNSGGKAAESYKDGAEKLEMKRSSSGQHSRDPNDTYLEEVDGIIRDPTNLMRKLSVVTGGRGGDDGSLENEDIPIIAPAPPGRSLKRSTRTNYRRGSLRNGERVGSANRRALAAKHAETDTEESPLSSPVSATSIQKISRAQTEPVAMPRDDSIENFSRPSRGSKGPIPPGASSNSSFDDILKNDVLKNDTEDASRGSPTSFKERVLNKEQNGRARPGQHPSSPSSSSQHPSSPSTSASPSFMEQPVPEIVETPPDDEDTNHQIPERTSSHEPLSSLPPQVPLPHGPPPSSRSSKHRPSALRPGSSSSRKSDQTLNDIVSQPSPLPGNSTRTDNLSFIPTFNDDKKSDKKHKKEKDRDTGEGGITRKASWAGWFSGDSKHKDKDKDKDSKEKEPSKKSIRRSKSSEKTQDDTRLDVLQKSIDGGRGRESLVLDRENLKLDDERKNSSRKSSGDKAKESSLFSSIFGGKKKGDKDPSKSKPRGLSPDPQPKVLRADIDYGWTRFPLIEERAIYRMAHIKLANPRRALYSQVLLSNFMYSYLDKVQAMQQHPQLTQAQIDEQNRVDNNSDAHEQQETQYYQSHEQSSEPTPYVDDAEIYDHDHPASGDYVENYNSQQNLYYGHTNQPQSQHQPQRGASRDEDEMW